jgi:phage terminase large subunit-like protein
MNSAKRLRSALKQSLRAKKTRTALGSLKAPTLQRLAHDFATLSHPHQRPPLAAGNGAPSGVPWTTWLMLGGRGAGKTRLGAEFTRALVFGHPPYADRPHASIALVGETEHDVREVMIEGPAGILHSSPRSERPTWTATRRRLEWGNGAVAYAFSAEDPEQLRGPQFDAAWCDELAKWHHAEATFDMLQFGLRHGTRPRQLVTTTPRPIPLIKRLVADPRTALTRAPTQANAAFLSPAFLSEILARYAGTQMGRQEIGGEIIEERADALWTRGMIEAARVVRAPDLMRILVGIDPPGSTRHGSDACGIVAAGVDEEGVIYVLADASAAGLAPAAWAAAAIALYRRLSADALVAESNFGGDMVRAVLAQVDAEVPVIEVHASRGKWLRAEPVAALYAQGRVKHVGAEFAALEDEMCDFGLGGLSGGRSPDRLDALVWAVTALMRRVSDRGFGPRITALGSDRPSFVPWWAERIR